MATQLEHECNADDIEEFLNDKGEELTNEELVSLEEERKAEGGEKKKK